MIPATAMIASKMSITIAVAGRTPGSYARPVSILHSVVAKSRDHCAVGGMVGHEEHRKMPRPPNGGGGLGYMKDGSPPWGGLGGYPFTPWERALGARGETSPSCMHTAYRPQRVKP